MRQQEPEGALNPQATETLSRCLVCDDENIPFAFWGKSLYDEYWYRYCRCRTCSLVFVNPRVPADRRYGRVVESAGEEAPFLRYAPFDLREIESNIVKPAARLLARSSVRKEKRKWLDIGCGIGNLLDVAHRHGYAPFGLELNQQLCRWMEQNRPFVRATQGLIGDLPKDEVHDVISADNVLEHVYEPRQFMTSVRAHLDPDGLLVIRVPNFNTLFRYLLQGVGKLSRSFVVDPDAHPCNYSKSSLEALLSRSGFRVLHSMEHLMLSYPLKFILGQRTHGQSLFLRNAALAAYSLVFPFDRLVPAGGIDITIFATPSAPA